jgi:hypothetical protein
MARVTDLERQRVERLAADLAPVLRAEGAVIVKVADVESVDRWRRAARRAGRLLGWSIRTGKSHDGTTVWAASDDWLLPPGEHERVAERASDRIFGRGRPTV